ncbi:hypothetical protein DL96DRAFT_1597845 [Flagelloscypha sp. PMI_526]|nr:hypothetical protein DL96DRAFT_1597845 [Flagelloscypha sp. PMI_526]
MARNREPPFTMDEFGYLVGTALVRSTSRPQREKSLPAPPSPVKYEATINFMSKLRRQASAFGASWPSTKRARVKASSIPSPPPTEPQAASIPAVYQAGGPLVFSFPPREGGRSLTQVRTDKKEKRDPSPFLLDRKPAPLREGQGNSSHSSNSSLSSDASNTSTASSSSLDFLSTPISAYFPAPPPNSYLPLDHIPTMREYRSLRKLRDAEREKAEVEDNVSLCESLDPFSALPTFVQGPSQDQISSTPAPSSAPLRRPSTSQGYSHHLHSQSASVTVTGTVPPLPSSPNGSAVSPSSKLKRKVRRRPSTAPDSCESSSQDWVLVSHQPDRRPVPHPPPLSTLAAKTLAREGGTNVPKKPHYTRASIPALNSLPRTLRRTASSRFSAPLIPVNGFPPLPSPPPTA